MVWMLLHVISSSTVTMGSDDPHETTYCRMLEICASFLLDCLCCSVGIAHQPMSRTCCPMLAANVLTLGRMFQPKRIKVALEAHADRPIHEYKQNPDGTVAELLTAYAALMHQSMHIGLTLMSRPRTCAEKQFQTLNSIDFAHITGNHYRPPRSTGPSQEEASIEQRWDSIMQQSRSAVLR
jgi:hypothetical protein